MGSVSTDVVFVTPSVSPSLRQESIGTLILAKKAQQANFSVRIVRFWDVVINCYDSFRKDLSDHILEFYPKIVCFYCRSAEYHILVDLANIIKVYRPNTYVVFGGPQAELVCEETLMSFPCIDYVCCGEGENTIVPLLDFLINEHDNTTIKRTINGLVYRGENNSIIKNPAPNMLPDNYVRTFSYYDMIPDEVIRASNSVTFDVGRGCPFSCTFCSTKTFWKQKFRLRDLSNTINEIEYIINCIGEKLLTFSHDHFTVSKLRVMNFCREISSLGRNIQWTCSSRIDCLDYEIIDVMASSGLVAIYFGVETGSMRMQRIINKNLVIQKCIDIVKYTIDKGICVTTSFIYGFPEESLDDLEETLKIIHSFLALGVDVQLHRLSFEAGSALYRKYHGELVFSREIINNKFGVKELSDLIENHPDVFSSFWDYPSELRRKMKYLQLFHKIGMTYPQIYHMLFNCMYSGGIKYVDAYLLVFELLKDTLGRIASKPIKFSRAICYFLFEKLIMRLLDVSCSQKYGSIKLDYKQLDKCRMLLNSSKRV